MTTENKSVAVTAQSKLEVAHTQMVEKIGSDIIKKTGELGGLYLQLCLYIRKNKVAPKLVSVTLTKQGFKRSRISEINRVAQASEKLFKDYEAKLIGFDKCLEFSRIENGKPVPTEAAHLLVDTGAITQDEGDAVIHDENTPGDAKGGKKTTSPAMRMKAHVKAACELAVRKSYEFRFGQYIVRFERTTPEAPSMGN